MNAIALLIFILVYTPRPVENFHIIPAIVEVAPAPLSAVDEQIPVRQAPRPQAAPAQPEHGQANPADFYNYTCPADQYPIGDGQCHINNDRPGDVVK